MTATRGHADGGAAPWTTTEFTGRLRAVTAARYHDRHPFNLRMHGSRAVDDIVAELGARFPGAPVADEVPEFLRMLRKEGWLR
ncbi:hypothetical protein [Streptomyces chartreusis]|uniref:hypothetical protein n=1 Tax=Streptomyces chartreusis TaxID=1969 RepID=UPI0033F58281